MSGQSSGDAARFPTTDWSLVGHAGDHRDRGQRVAIDELLKRYLPALRAHLVAVNRLNPHDADDVLQGFLVNKVLERNLVSVAEPSKGRFRSLLVTALNNYVANQMRRRSAQKRAVDRAVPVAPGDQDRQSGSQVTPAQSFDVEWARQLLQEVAGRMKAECTASGREDLWGVFEGRVLMPAVEGAEPSTYDEIVRRFRFRSPQQASNALITAKRMYARLLRGAVAEYVLDGEDIDTEISDLERIVSG